MKRKEKDLIEEQPAQGKCVGVFRVVLFCIRILLIVIVVAAAVILPIIAFLDIYRYGEIVNPVLIFLFQTISDFVAWMDNLAKSLLGDFRFRTSQL